MAYIYGDDVAVGIAMEGHDDLPFFIRYCAFMRSFLSLKWGHNAAGRDIRELIASRFPVTLSLTLISGTISILFSFPLAVHASVRKDSFSEKLLSAASAIGLSLPSFLIAFMLIIVFAVTLRLFPVAGYIPLESGVFSHIRSLFLPSLTVAAVQSALYPRMFMNALRDSLGSDYIAASRAWGLSDGEALFREALRPSMPVAIAMLFQNAVSGIAGSAVVETVFALPGIGSMLVSAALARDSILLGISLLLLSVISAVLFIISEILIAVADPRIGRQYA